MKDTVTVSVIKADIGSCPGHVEAPEELVEIVRKYAKQEGVQKGLLLDSYTYSCGDDIGIVMLHEKGEDNQQVHELAWNAFIEGTKFAKQNKLYGAGQDLLADAFSGNVKGQGPGVAEMEFVRRPSDPVIVFAADKTDPSAYSLPLFRIFADPFNTSGLIIDPKCAVGFSFEILDFYEDKYVTVKCPEEMYTAMALLGTSSRYAIKRVYKNDLLEKDKQEAICAVVSTEKLSQIAGEYVGKDDPVAVVRAQSGFPAVGEVTEGFTLGHLVPGFMRGSHRGPLTPTSLKDAKPSRFDGPPRVVALGFQVGQSKLFGPRDIFADISFDITRKRCMEVSDYLRRHGSFEPHRLGEKEMEYTTLPKILDTLKNRFTAGEKVKRTSKVVTKGHVQPME